MGGDGRRRQVRAGAGRGQRDRARRPDCDGNGERGAGDAKAVGTGEWRAGVGCRGQGAARNREGAGRRQPRRPRERAVEPRPDVRLCAGQRLRNQRAVAAGLLRDGVSGGAGDEFRRGNLSGHRTLRAKRTAPGRAGQRCGIRAQNVSRPCHQGDGRLHRLGAGPGPGGAIGNGAPDGCVSAGAGTVSGQVQRLRGGPRSVPRGRGRRRRRDLHRARGRNPHHSHGDPTRGFDHRLPRAEAALMRARLVCQKFLAVAAAAVLAGCALKPVPTTDELRRDALPHTNIPAGWKAAGGAAGPVADRWLATFDDPALSELVAEALTYNADLQAAAGRVEQGSGYVAGGSGSIYPSVGLAATQSGKSGVGGGLNAVFLNASLELDVWGRLRYGEAAAESQSAAVQADYAYARQSLAAMVAKSWFVAIEAGVQSAIVIDSLRSSESLTNLSQDLPRIGNGNEQAVAEARANLGSHLDI